jgi:hypothetical protein
MTKLEIITKAQLYLDDTSDLSTQEISDLFDMKYAEYNSRKPWEGTKKSASGTTSITLPYVDLPTDFRYLVQNANYTSSNYASSRPVVFLGVDYRPYEVVSWSDRRQYLNRDGFAYVDIANNSLYFTAQPTVAESYEFDYQSVMPVLTDNESPWFPYEFHPVLFHEMVVDDFVIQQSDKAKSYKDENQAMARRYFNNHEYQNAKLVQM